MFLDLNTDRIKIWMYRVFGDSAIKDVEERAIRFGEEAIELIQSLGLNQHQVEALVKQVYAKEPGDPMQELGGTLIGLSALCAVTNLEPTTAGNAEFDRIEEPEMMVKIRNKHLTKAVVSSNFAGRRGVEFDEGTDPIYGDNYTRSVKRSDGVEGRNFVD